MSKKQENKGLNALFYGVIKSTKVLTYPQDIAKKAIEIADSFIEAIPEDEELNDATLLVVLGTIISNPDSIKHVSSLIESSIKESEILISMQTDDIDDSIKSEE